MPNRMFFKLESRDFFDPSTAIASELLDYIYSELVHEERIRSWRGVKSGPKDSSNNNKNRRKPPFKRNSGTSTKESVSSGKETPKTNHLTIVEEVTMNSEDEEKEVKRLISHYLTQEEISSVISFRHPKFSFFDREESGTILTQMFRDPFNELQNKIRKIQEYAPTKEVAYTKAYMNPPMIDDYERLLQILCLLDSGSNCNYISQDLTKLLKLQVKPKLTEHMVSGGKVTTKGEVNVTFAVFGKRDDEGFILRNVKMSVIVKSSGWIKWKR